MLASALGLRLASPCLASTWVLQTWAQVPLAFTESILTQEASPQLPYSFCKLFLYVSTQCKNTITKCALFFFFSFTSWLSDTLKKCYSIFSDNTKIRNNNLLNALLFNQFDASVKASFLLNFQQIMLLRSTTLFTSLSQSEIASENKSSITMTPSD